ncbi:oxidoreductase [Betaproteobacteria bacterium GR16-43]|nr:oxidoreductase [Betaproteobacteria bacterium GR16-43]
MMKVGLIGAGWVTQHHLRAWRSQHPRAKVVAIADPSADRASDRAREFDIPVVFPSAARLVERGDIDAIDVASPREFHAEAVRLAADRGIPVLCQKPLAPNFAEAERLADEVAGRTRLMVHENWRFRRYYREARAWLDGGVAGQVVQARMTLLSSGLIPDAAGKLPGLERQPFMRGLDRMLVMEVLIHHLDTLRFLLGPLTVEASRIGRTCPQIRGEDHALVTLATRTGAAVILHGNMAAHGHPPAFRDRLEILGDRATIAFEEGRLTATGAETREVTFDLAETYQASYDAVVGHFVDALRFDAPFETAPADNLETLKLVERIYQLDGR